MRSPCWWASSAAWEPFTRSAVCWAWWVLELIQIISSGSPTDYFKLCLVRSGFLPNLPLPRLPQYFTCLVLILIAQIVAGSLIYFQKEEVSDVTSSSVILVSRFSVSLLGNVDFSIQFVVSPGSSLIGWLVITWQDNLRDSSWCSGAPCCSNGGVYFNLLHILKFLIILYVSLSLSQYFQGILFLWINIILCLD